MGSVALLSLDTLLADYRDGDGHGWDVEFSWINRHHTQHIATLTDDIREHGIREPIALGSDGRVWDGHHRLLAAQILGLAQVPVLHV